MQQKILKYLHSRPDTWCCKMEIASERGVPDILAVKQPGFMVAIEVKETGEASVIQKEQIRRIKAAGGRARIVGDYDSFVKWYEDI